VHGKVPSPDYTPTLRLDDDCDATSLIIRCRDTVTNLLVELIYTVLHKEDIITRRSCVVNNTDDVVKVDLLSSTTLDLDTNEFYMTQLSGAWARERQIVSQRLTDGVSAVESRRGASSHQHNPFVLFSVGGPPCETAGEAIGLGLMYSGSWSCVAEVSSETGRLRVQMGINEQGFMWRLEPGDRFGSPEVVMCYSANGTGGVSRQMHRLVRKHIIPPRWRGRRSPIVLNTVRWRVGRWLRLACRRRLLWHCSTEPSPARLHCVTLWAMGADSRLWRVSLSLRVACFCLLGRSLFFLDLLSA